MSLLELTAKQMPCVAQLQSALKRRYLQDRMQNLTFAIWALYRLSCCHKDTSHMLKDPFLCSHQAPQASCYESAATCRTATQR